MEKVEALNILEQMAAGMHPFTHEKLAEDHLLNERKVIRALQMAIDVHLWPREATVSTSAKAKNVEIPAEYAMHLSGECIDEYLAVLKERKLKCSSAMLAKSLFGSVQGKQAKHYRALDFYGVLRGKVSVKLIEEKINTYLVKQPVSEVAQAPQEAWKNVAYFKHPNFSFLEADRQAAIGKQIALIPGVKKPEQIPAYMQKARLQYPRAYEPWLADEKLLLEECLGVTNDLKLLSTLFLRGAGAIKNMGQKLIYEKPEIAQQLDK